MKSKLFIILYISGDLIHLMFEAHLNTYHQMHADDIQRDQADNRAALLLYTAVGLHEMFELGIVNSFPHQVIVML
jgi:hypothetical protein